MILTEYQSCIVSVVEIGLLGLKKRLKDKGPFGILAIFATVLRICSSNDKLVPILPTNFGMFL